MIKIGIAASRGYAVGRVYIKPPQSLSPVAGIHTGNGMDTDGVMNNAVGTPDAAAEKEKLALAIEKAKQELITLKEKTLAEIGESEAGVFISHQQLLEDPEVRDAAFEEIESSGVSAQTAVHKVILSLVELFSQLEDEYMRERAADIKDIGLRLMRILSGAGELDLSDLPPDTILVAHDLTPSDTARLNRERVCAFVTETGGSTSHSAIMARKMEIPAVTGAEGIVSLVANGDCVIVDGFAGEILIHPDSETLQAYRLKQEECLKEKEALKALASVKTVAPSGKTVLVCANIGSPGDVAQVLAQGAEGIGLFRTEFLYMDRNGLPSEEEQYEAYKTVAQKMEGKPVVIRTLDIGGDKRLPYLPLPEEMNPFMGMRAIRLCLKRRELFRTQLRAILRAGVYGNIQIMFPMIATVEEFLEAKGFMAACMEELQREGAAFRENMETGIMIEIPAAALNAEELAKHVDFFSIGTNDLIQYTLAVDRMNESVAYLYDPMNKGVLKLIKMTIEAAHREGKWCGMCGEMAGDEKAIPLLLEYGLDEFSMSPSIILNARRLIMNA